MPQTTERTNFGGSFDVDGKIILSIHYIHTSETTLSMDSLTYETNNRRNKSLFLFFSFFKPDCDAAISAK